MNYSYKLTCLLCGTTPEHLMPVDHDDLARLQENLENLMRLQKHIKKEHGFSEQDLQKAVCHTAYLWKKPDEEGYYMQAIELPT